MTALSWTYFLSVFVLLSCIYIYILAGPPGQQGEKGEIGLQGQAGINGKNGNTYFYKVAITNKI